MGPPFLFRAGPDFERSARGRRGGGFKRITATVDG